MNIDEFINYLSSNIHKFGLQSNNIKINQITQNIYKLKYDSRLVSYIDISKPTPNVFKVLKNINQKKIICIIDMLTPNLSILSSINNPHTYALLLIPIDKQEYINIAINNNIDYFITNETNEYSRYASCVNYVYRSFNNIYGIILCKSTHILKNYIESCLNDIDNNLLMGKKIIYTNTGTLDKMENDTIFDDGLTLSHKLLEILNGNIFNNANTIVQGILNKIDHIVPFNIINGTITVTQNTSYNIIYPNISITPMISSKQTDNKIPHIIVIVGDIYLITQNCLSNIEKYTKNNIYLISRKSLSYSYPTFIYKKKISDEEAIIETIDKMPKNNYNILIIHDYCQVDLSILPNITGPIGCNTINLYNYMTRLSSIVSSYPNKIFLDGLIINKKILKSKSFKIILNTLVSQVPSEYIKLFVNTTIENTFRKTSQHNNQQFIPITNEIVTKNNNIVSIIIPTYNGYPHIKNIVSQIKSQTHKEIELIIVNDGSTQLELIRYLKTIKDAKIIHIKNNKGLPNALNVGMSNISGSQWTWISDDNEITDNMIQKLKNKLDQGYDFVYSNHINQNFQGKTYIDINYYKPYDLLNNWQGMCSFMWKTSLLDIIGKFDVSIQGCEDYDFNIKTFITTNKIGKVDDHLFIYNIRNNTISTRLKNKIPIMTNETKIKYKDHGNITKLIKNRNKILCFDEPRNFVKNYIVLNIDTITVSVYVNNFMVNDIIYCTHPDQFMGYEKYDKIILDMKNNNYQLSHEPKYLISSDIISDGIVNNNIIPNIPDNFKIYCNDSFDDKLYNLIYDKYDLTSENINDTSAILYLGNDLNQIYQYLMFKKPVICKMDLDYVYVVNDMNYDQVIENIKNNILESPEYVRNMLEQLPPNYKEHLIENKIEQFNNIFKIKYTIIYPPTISYDELMQRPTQFMKQLHKIKNIQSIFVDSDIYSEEYITPYFKRINKNNWENKIDKYRQGKLILYYTNPDHIITKQYDYIIFDLIDNPVEEFSLWDKNLISCITNCDLFVTSAKIMYDKYNKYNKNTILIPNGCDYDHFSVKINKSNIFNTDKIVIGYYGAHASWVDFDLINKIANHNPNKYQIVMVGRNNAYNISINNDNIMWFDHVSYYELPKYLAHFDICMIPFKLTEMIKGCDPIKFYEYLAANKPIITTKMEPLLRFEKHCNFIDHNNYGKVIDNINYNIDSNNIAKNNSWESRVNVMLNSFEENKIKYTILYPKYIVWNKMFQRPQQMLTALSKLPNIRCVFIDYSIKSDNMINNYLILCPNYESAKKYLKGEIILYYNNYVDDEYEYDISIYELVDNPVDEFSSWQNTLEKNIQKADYISLTSSVMAKYVSDKLFTVIPNGCDYEYFSNSANKINLKLPNKIIIGYYGAHATWVDWNLITKIADLNYVHVLMIGKSESPPYNISIPHNNITYIPLQPYTELTKYLSHFDICMIPFKLTDMIKGCDPIKFYEYCASGKPVIATKMLELIKYENECYFVDNNNYENIIKKAIDEKNNIELINNRKKLAKNNTWKNRAKDFVNIFTQI